MAGDWTTDDLTGVLAAFAANMRGLVPAGAAAAAPRRAQRAARPPRQHHRRRARDNIQRHYDLSNDLFKLFLDESMTYSSAIFAGEPHGSRRRPRRRAAAQDRPAARRRRRRRGHPAARDRHRLGRTRDPRRARAARTSRRLTISDRAGRARPRADRRGRADATASTVLLQDYRAGTRPLRRRRQRRDDRGGRREPLGRLLRDDRPAARCPGGRVGLQAILQDDDTRCAPPGHLHLDPQVHLPRRSARVGRGDRAASLAEHTSLRIADRYSFGRHYAETLRRWRERFEQRARRGRRARLRRDVPPHVVALPRLLRGGLPHRLPRRRAVHPDQAQPDR